MQSPSRVEFDFNSGRASPCGSSPSTPKGFGHYYFSAPTTPARAKSIYRQVDDFFHARGEASTSTLPFDLSYSTNIEPTTPHYAEKFRNDGTIIRPMKPPPYDEGGSKHRVETIRSPLLSPMSTKSQHKKSFWSAFSPKRKKDQFDDQYEFTRNNKETRNKKQGREREQERVSVLAKTSRTRRRAARSLSPIRKSMYPWEEDEEQSSKATNTKQLSLSSSTKGSKKWSLKNLLLFRSSSEGRALDKDPLKNYSYFRRKQHEVAKNTGSQYSTEGSGTAIAVRKGPISAHELHYTVNRAISEDLKKKSFLPYKQGILGRLAFNPTVHALAHGFGSLA